MKTKPTAAFMDSPGRGGFSLSRPGPGRLVIPALLAGWWCLQCLASSPPSETEVFRVSATIAVGRGPHGIRFSPNGSRALVACSGEDRVAIVNCRTGSLISRVRAGRTPLDLVRRPGGRRWIVTQFRGHRLIAVDSQSGKELRSWEVGSGPSLFAPRIINGMAFVVSELAGRLTIFDLGAERVSRQLSVGRRPYPASVTRDGERAFIPSRDDNRVTVVDLVHGKILARIPVGPRPDGGALTHGDDRYLVACGGSHELIVIDASTLTAFGPVKGDVGRRPFPVAVTPDDRFALVGDAGGDRVSVIDLGKRSVVQHLQVGEQPIVIRIHPDGRRVFVSNEISGTLSVLARVR